MRMFLAAFAMFTACCGLARADPTVRIAMAEFKNGNQATIAYLKGVRDGIGWVNTMMGQSGQAPFYCQPEKLALTIGQQMDMLSRFLAENPRIIDDQVGIVLLLTLKDAFPCQK